jgi:hypothetical protein
MWAFKKTLLRLREFYQNSIAKGNSPLLLQRTSTVQVFKRISRVKWDEIEKTYRAHHELIMSHFIEKFEDLIDLARNEFDLFIEKKVPTPSRETLMIVKEIMHFSGNAAVYEITEHKLNKKLILKGLRPKLFAGELNLQAIDLQQKAYHMLYPAVSPAALVEFENYLNNFKDFSISEMKAHKVRALQPLWKLSKDSSTAMKSLYRRVGELKRIKERMDRDYQEARQLTIRSKILNRF